MCTRSWASAFASTSTCLQVHLRQFDPRQRASDERTLATGGFNFAVIEDTNHFAEVIGAYAQVLRGPHFRLRHANHPTTLPGAHGESPNGVTNLTQSRTIES